MAHLQLVQMTTALPPVKVPHRFILIVEDNIIPITITNVVDKNIIL
jgi:hypothetical protein